MIRDLRFGGRRILIVGACDSQGAVYCHAGLSPGALLAHKRGGNSVSSFGRNSSSIPNEPQAEDEYLRFANAQILAEQCPAYDVLLEAVCVRTDSVAHYVNICMYATMLHAEPGEPHDWGARVFVYQSRTVPHSPSPCHFRQQGAAGAVLRRARVSGQQCTSPDSPQVSICCTATLVVACKHCIDFMFLYIKLHCYVISALMPYSP